LIDASCFLLFVYLVLFFCCLLFIILNFDSCSLLLSPTYPFTYIAPQRFCISSIIGNFYRIHMPGSNCEPWHFFQYTQLKYNAHGLFLHTPLVLKKNTRLGYPREITQGYPDMKLFAKCTWWKMNMFFQHISMTEKS